MLVLPERTPHLVQAIWRKREALGVDSLTMMDIDARRLGLMEKVVAEMIGDRPSHHCLDGSR